MSKFLNFTEESCTGIGDTQALGGATSGNIPFSRGLVDGEQVHYVIDDSGGVIKVAGVGTYVLATDDITRNDTWNDNGTTTDEKPTTNIALSGGTHTIRCDVISKGLSNQNGVLDTWLESGYYDYPDNWGIPPTQSDVVSANRCTYASALLARPRVLTNLVIAVNTADVGATLSKAGIYTAGVDGKPSVLLGSVNIDVTTTGTKVVALATPLELDPGWYFMAFATDGIPAMRMLAVNAVIRNTHGLNLGVPRIYVPYETLVGWSDLPATPNPVMGENYGAAVMWS